MTHKRIKCKKASFSLVIRTQQEQNTLYRCHKQERPENKRQRAEYQFFAESLCSSASLNNEFEHIQR